MVQGRIFFPPFQYYHWNALVCLTQEVTLDYHNLPDCPTIWRLPNIHVCLFCAMSSCVVTTIIFYQFRKLMETQSLSVITVIHVKKLGRKKLWNILILRVTFSFFFSTYCVGKEILPDFLCGITVKHVEIFIWET